MVQSAGIRGKSGVKIDIASEKQARFKPPKGKEKFVAPSNVVNLMEALRQSIAQDRKAPPAKRGKKRIEGQREMLLPISGKKAAAEAEKKPVRSGARQKRAG